MNIPKSPADTPPRRPVSGPTADALADLPPMPKTKPARSAQARRGAAATPADPAQSDGGLDAVTKKELFTRVKARADGVKGRDVRLVMDALLDELGDALVAGEALKLPALGTLKVQRHKSRARADVVICKLRRKKRGPGVKDPLAEPAEEG